MISIKFYDWNHRMIIKLIAISIEKLSIQSFDCINSYKLIDSINELMFLWSFEALLNDQINRSYNGSFIMKNFDKKLKNWPKIEKLSKIWPRLGSNLTPPKPSHRGFAPQTPLWGPKTGPENPPGAVFWPRSSWKTRFSTSRGENWHFPAAKSRCETGFQKSASRPLQIRRGSKKWNNWPKKSFFWWLKVAVFLMRPQKNGHIFKKFRIFLKI